MNSTINALQNTSYIYTIKQRKEKGITSVLKYTQEKQTDKHNK